MAVVACGAALPGYARGLAFHGRFAFVGLSQIREKDMFGGMPIAVYFGLLTALITYAVCLPLGVLKSRARLTREHATVRRDGMRQRAGRARRSLRPLPPRLRPAVRRGVRRRRARISRRFPTRPSRWRCATPP